jgi:PAS domain S-box-containing protein
VHLEARGTNQLTNPDIRGVVVSVRNVTERMLAEDALRNSEALFRAVVENSYDGVLLINKDFQITYVSPSHRHISGYSHEETVGTQALDYVHPDDQARVERELHRCSLEPGTHVSLEYRVRHRLGHWVLIEATVTNLLLDPAVHSFLVISRDVTHQKQTEGERARIQTQLQHFAGEQQTRLSILTTISQALSANMALEPLLETVHREIGRLFDTTDFLIALHKPGSTEWDLVFRSAHGVMTEPMRHSIHSGLIGFTIRSGQPLLIPNFEEVQENLRSQGITSLVDDPLSWMCVPLTVGELVVGAMAISDSAHEAAYSLDDLELFKAIASQVAASIRIAQFFEGNRRRSREMETLVAIGQNTSSSLDLETVLLRAADDTLALLTGDSIGILLKESDGVLKMFASAGAIANQLLGLRIPPKTGIIGSIAESGKAEIVNDTANDPRGIHVPGTKPDEPCEKLMSAPLTLRGEVIGAIAVWRNPEHPVFEEDDLRFLEAIGRQVSIAIWNARLFGDSKRAQADAEQANTAKSAFLARMSHELRTPLNAILLYSELLRDEVLDRGLGDLASDLNKIHGAGKHLLGLINEVLDLSKIEAGKMPVVLEDFLLPTLLEEIVSTAQPLMSRNRNTFVLVAEPSIQMIHSDAQKIRQIVFNLLSNAAKFTKDGTIRLTVEHDPERAGMALISVHDTGMGMDQAQLSRIFQAFTQAEETISRDFGGTGLGLTLSQKFTELLGGHVHVVSSPGEGSCFFVSLPGLPGNPQASRQGA